MTKQHSADSSSEALAQTLGHLEQQQAISEELEGLRSQLEQAGQAVSDTAEKIEEARAARHRYAQTRHKGTDVYLWESHEQKRHAELTAAIERASAAHAQAEQHKAEIHRQIRDAEARHSALECSIKTEVVAECLEQIAAMETRAEELQALIEEQEAVASAPMPVDSQTPALQAQREELLSELAQGAKAWNTGESVGNIDQALEQAAKEHAAACAVAIAQQKTATDTAAGLRRCLAPVRAELEALHAKLPRLQKAAVRRYAEQAGAEYERAANELWERFKAVYALARLARDQGAGDFVSYWANKLYVPRFPVICTGRGISADPKQGALVEIIGNLNPNHHAELPEPIATALASIGVTP